MKKFTLSFDTWTTDRKVVRTSEYQLVLGSVVKVKSPKYFIAAHQTAASSGVANKSKKVSVFDHVDVRKDHVKIDGAQYPMKSVIILFFYQYLPQLIQRF